jgi:hypothetical protein
MARLPSIPALPVHGYMGMDASDDAFTPPTENLLLQATVLNEATPVLVLGGYQ